MIKTILPSAYDFQDKLASLVDVHSKGVDKSWMSKRAAAGIFKGADIKPVKDHSFIHLIAMGDSEAWGFNRNSDAFLEKASTVEIPHPEKGKSKFLKIAAGNKETHGTFKSHALVFRNHNNKDPKQAHGTVEKAAHNDDMHRVELIIKVPDATWGDELEKLASGGDVPFSMSCTTDPTYPVRTINGYTPIGELKIGDLVFTHTGEFKPVTQLLARNYTGKVYSVRVNGWPVPLELTEDHPMYGILFEYEHHAKRFFADPSDFDKYKPDWTHIKHFKAGDRLMYRAIKTIPGFGAIDDIDLARLMGYYLAEGSFGFNDDIPSMVMFTCNTVDEMPRVIPEILARLWPDITVSVAADARSKFCLRVSVFSTEFAKFFYKYVGHLCKRKYICPELFNASRDVKLAFMGGWFSGDGFIDNKGVHWSTVSPSLALQGRDLLASIGIATSIYRIDHTNFPNPSGGPGSIEYTLNVSHLDSVALLPWSEKLKLRLPELVSGHMRTKPTCLRPCGEYSAYRIKTIEARDVIDVPVFNIEVADTHSYSFAGLVSHNCKIPFDHCSECGHQAKTRREYCSHLKENMGEITKEGNHIGAINDHMCYFDISKVVVPADRTAFGLLKAASDLSRTVGGAELAEQLFPEEDVDDSLVLGGSRLNKLAMIRKLSEIEKQIEASAGGGHMGKCMSAFDPEVSGDIPDADIKKLTPSAGHAGDVLGALADVKISLSIKDFLKIILGNKFGDVAEHVDEAKSMLPGMFGRLTKSPASTTSGFDDFDLSDGLVPRQMRETISKLVGAHSLDDEPVQRRVMTIVIRGKSPMKPAVPVDMEKKSGKASSLAERMAMAYAMYKVAFCRRMDEVDGALVERAVLQNYV